MERNAIAATVLVIMILLGYQWYLARFEAPAQEAPRTAAAPSEPQKSVPTPSMQPAAPSGKAAFYRVYWRTDKMPFYSLWADVKEGGEAVVKNYSREHLWLVVVAVDKDGEESGFEKEIKGWNDGAK